MQNKELKNSDNQVDPIMTSTRVVDAEQPDNSTTIDEEQQPEVVDDETTVSVSSRKLPEIVDAENTVSASHTELPEEVDDEKTVSAPRRVLPEVATSEVVSEEATIPTSNGKYSKEAASEVADHKATVVASNGKLSEVVDDETTVSAFSRKLPEVATLEAPEVVSPILNNSNADEEKAISMDSEKSTQGKNVTSSSESKPVKENTRYRNAKVVRADSVQAEEVPTIPMDSLYTLDQLQPEVTVRSVAATRNISNPSSLVELPSEYRRGFGETLQTWWHGMRPAYLTLSLMPAILGSILAWTQTFSPTSPFGHFKIVSFIGTLLAIALIQVGANLINDYYDYRKGIDTSNPFGPGGLIQQGLASQTRILYSGLVALIVGAFVGFIVVASSGVGLPLIFGLLGLICAYFYSGSSRSLVSLVLGELTAFVVFGPLIVLGAYLVQGGAHMQQAFVYSLPLGLLAMAVVHVNNIRDVESDIQGEKRTIASLMSLPLNRMLYCVLLICAYLLLIVLAIPSHGPHLLLIALWTLPTASLAISGILRTDAPANFNLVMHQTLRLLGFFAFWMSLALLALAVWPLLPLYPNFFLHL
ncbi:MAG TPA: 1,4-dihydroxy-2-naphthoate octaprenyltransferase [Ktedonobacteraceae bacterium]|nr:1,4-dihydroxy-2-naphthoate octaprenyltransferase [Ktedonobacteraceae bacterium]